MMERSETPTTLWQRERRAFIEHRVFWHGSIGLADLMNVMGISRAQASKDLNAYITDHPNHLLYDKSARTYVMGAAFSPHYSHMDAGEFLADLAALSRGVDIPKADWIVTRPAVLAAAVPTRELDPFAVRTVLQACDQKRKLALTYQSMSAQHPETREIAPYGVVHDGFRWHARAFCLRDEIFKDFVLSRMSNLCLGSPVNIDPANDVDWLQTVVLRIAPHPGLSPSQKRAIEADYGMVAGTAELEVRKCLLIYNLKRLGLDTYDTERPPQDQHIVLVNRSEVNSAMGKSTK